MNDELEQRALQVIDYLEAKLEGHSAEDLRRLQPSVSLLTFKALAKVASLLATEESLWQARFELRGWDYPGEILDEFLGEFDG